MNTMIHHKNTEDDDNFLRKFSFLFSEWEVQKNSPIVFNAVQIDSVMRPRLLISIQLKQAF